MFKLLSRKAPKIAQTLTGYAERWELREDNTATRNGAPVTPEEFWAAVRTAEWTGLTLTSY